MHSCTSTWGCFRWSICLSVRPSVGPSVQWTVFIHRSFHLSVHPSVHLSVYLSVNLSVNLSVRHTWAELLRLRNGIFWLNSNKTTSGICLSNVIVSCSCCYFVQIQPGDPICNKSNLQLNFGMSPSFLQSSSSPSSFSSALWSKTLARPFPHSLTPLTRLLALDCSPHSRPPLRSLVRSLAHFAHSLTPSLVGQWMIGWLCNKCMFFPISMFFICKNDCFVCVFFYFRP